YLGDVTSSVTGDKKAQLFEDGYLDELMAILRDIGFRAISYMPSRNTREQLLRLRALCEKHQMLQISGEDINSPGQPFICEAMRAPMFANLRDTTWALIGHEAAASEDISRALIYADMPIDQKIRHYGRLGRELHNAVD
ncbi:MAG: PHP domain-containing protein, partial [Oscillospiraceae bacterium]|nr:PHP domain-containing protein [Oscillospiraceae bacterium]